MFIRTGYEVRDSYYTFVYGSLSNLRAGYVKNELYTSLWIADFGFIHDVNGEQIFELLVDYNNILKNSDQNYTSMMKNISKFYENIQGDIRSFQ